MKFKVLVGKHCEKFGSELHTFRAGQVVDSKHDLAKLFNREGAKKFEAVDGGVKASDPTRVVPAQTPLQDRATTSGRPSYRPSETKGESENAPKAETAKK